MSKLSDTLFNDFLTKCTSVFVISFYKSTEVQNSAQTWLYEVKTEYFMQYYSNFKTNFENTYTIITLRQPPYLLSPINTQILLLILLWENVKKLKLDKSRMTLLNSKQ